ncbi:helix-turn-helix transcriptional regulator [Streptomyces sp. NPDC006997]|uniref:helix-turn-helix domain-containing protein n=1 Tax=Streptomyces sp. NPDC006997 TaxID=3155356 RepID=UPI0034119AFC
MTNYDGRSEGVDVTEARVASELIAHSAELEADAELNRRYGPPAEHPLNEVDGESLASYNLRRIRKELNVSQQQIADRIAEVGEIKLSQTQIAKIERGERPWRVNEMFAIAEALGVDHTELFTGQAATNDPHMLVLAARLKLKRARTLEYDAQERWRDAAYHRFECEESFVRVAAAYAIEDAEVLNVLRARWFQQRRVEAAESGLLTGGKSSDQQDEMQNEASAFAREEWERYRREAEQQSSKSDADLPLESDREE